jgi:hypothetical protein
MGDNFPGPNAGYVPVGTFVSADGKYRRKFGIEAPPRPAATVLRAGGRLPEWHADAGASAGGPPAGAAEETAGDIASEVDALLARFPGPVTLNPSRLKSLVLLAVCLGFLVGLTYLLQHGTLGPAGAFKAWLGTVLFAAGALIGAVMLLPGAARLTLCREGFERVALFVTRRTAWSQASGFVIGECRSRGGRPTRMVAYDDVGSWGASAETRRKLVGRNCALPDTYGLSHEDLARLMTQWRERALAQRRS